MDLPSNRRLWLAVSAVFALGGSLLGVWAARIPAIAQRHDLDSGTLGLVLLCLAAGAILAFPLAGRWADRAGAAGVTKRLAVLYTLSLIPVALAPNTLCLVIALFVFGAMHGGMDVTMNAWAAEVERHIGRPVMSSFHAMFSLGAGLGGASGYLAARAEMGIVPHFLLAGTAFAALAFVLVIRGPWHSPRGTAQQSAPVFAIPTGPLLPVGIVAFCAMLGEGAVTDWSAIFLVLTTGASEAKAALGYTLFSAAMVVMRLLGDRATRAFGPVLSTRLAGTTAAIGILCAVGFASLPAALLGFTLMGIGYAVIMPLALSRAANDPTLPAGAAIARIATLGYGGLLLGPPVIGFIAGVSSLRAAFLVLACLSILMIVLAGTMAQRSRDRT